MEMGLARGIKGIKGSLISNNYDYIVLRRMWNIRQMKLRKQSELFCFFVWDRKQTFTFTSNNLG